MASQVSGSVAKNPPAKAEDVRSIRGSGVSPGEENGNRLQYSCLENSMDGGVWRATVHVAKSQTETQHQQQHMKVCMSVCLCVICVFVLCVYLQ